MQQRPLNPQFPAAVPSHGKPPSLEVPLNRAPRPNNRPVEQNKQLLKPRPAWTLELDNVRTSDPAALGEKRRRCYEGELSAMTKFWMRCSLLSSSSCPGLPETRVQENIFFNICPVSRTRMPHALHAIIWLFMQSPSVTETEDLYNLEAENVCSITQILTAANWRMLLPKNSQLAQSRISPAYRVRALRSSSSSSSMSLLHSSQGLSGKQSMSALMKRLLCICW